MSEKTSAVVTLCRSRIFFMLDRVMCSAPRVTLEPSVQMMIVNTS